MDYVKRLVDERLKRLDREENNLRGSIEGLEHELHCYEKQLKEIQREKESLQNK